MTVECKIDGLALDIIKDTFFLENYNDLIPQIYKMQEKFIESRIKWFWALPLVRRFTVRRVKLLCVKPDIEILGQFKIIFTQRVMLVGVTEFWALLLLKRRK